MTVILVLGGYGYTGRLLARHLLAQTAVDVILAGRRLDKADALARQLNEAFPGGRASARCVDAASRESLLAGLAGVDFLLVASPTTRYTEVVARAALDAGVDMLDIQMSAHKLAVLKSLAGEAERAGRCIITEAGFHPGLPSALVRFAAARLDRLDTAVTAGFLNMGHDLPYSEAVTELMEAFIDYQAQVYVDGAWTKPSAYKMRTIDFGDAIGKKPCVSMFFEELRELPAMFPSLREAGFYIAGSHWVTDWLLAPIVMAGLKLAPHRGLRPMGRLMWWGMQNFHRPPYIVALRVDATGERDGRPARLAATVSHPDGYELTAIPVVACLMQVLDGSARRPGVWMMGHLADPERLFTDMQRMGAGFTYTLDG